jgi:DNA primase
LFLNHEVVLLPDGDAGGETLRKTVEKEFDRRGKSIRVLKLPAGKDVADVIATMGKD